MKRVYSLLFALIFNALALFSQAAKTFEYRNGLWFNGTDFTEGSWFVVGGKLTQKAPAKIDSVVDLEKRWIVPPIGDAFSSCLAGNPSAREAIKLYQSEGIFYLQILSNSQVERKAIEPLLNKSDAPDAIFANGGITCTLGTPFLKYESAANKIHDPEEIVIQRAFINGNRKMLGDGYWFFDKKDDLSKNWDKLKSQRPGVVSIYLLDAENNGGKEGKGLTPEMAKAVVKKAQKADWQVFAHIETVADARLAIKLGVNGLANLPGYNWQGEGDPQRFELSDDDLKKMAKKKIAVVPLLWHGQTAAMKNPLAAAFQKKTLTRLVAAGVPVAIGSNDESRTVRSELNYWTQLNCLPPRDIIRILCVSTPQAIFPNRKIGKFAEGYEASFLVLNDDPLTNALKMRAIAFKVKNGILLKS